MSCILQRRHVFGWFIIIAISIIMFMFAAHHYCTLINSKPNLEYICIEDPQLLNRTGLEVVKTLPVAAVGARSFKVKKVQTARLTKSENGRYYACVKNFEDEWKKGQSEFWDGDTQFIRRTHHTYLQHGQSIMIDVGGNVGEDAVAYLRMYQPKYLVVLEPLKLLYRQLGNRLHNFTNAIVYNVGLGDKYETFMIRMEGNVGDATSPFYGSEQGTCSVKVVNALDFFQRLGVGSFKVDLLTINCEGCEYALLESIVSSNLINHFKHIQFATHAKLKELQQPTERYCKLQELLRRTHLLTYQYRYTWETWKLNSL